MTAVIKTKEAMERKQATAYELTRNWFDFAFENQDKVSPGHGMVFLWNVELCNRMGWANKFSSPASQTMAACGISSYNTYKKILDDLVAWRFIEIIQPSKNQYTANVIALSNFNNALNKALDKAVMNHLTKQSESTVQSTDSIIKQQTTNKETLNHKQEGIGASAIPPSKNDSEILEAKTIQLKTESEEFEEKEKKVSAPKKEKDLAVVEFSKIYKEHFPEYDFKPPRDEPKLKNIYDRIKRGFKAVSGKEPTLEEACYSFTMLISNLDPWHIQNGLITPEKIDKHFEVHKANLKKTKSNSPNPTAKSHGKPKYDFNELLAEVERTAGPTSFSKQSS